MLEDRPESTEKRISVTIDLLKVWKWFKGRNKKKEHDWAISDHTFIEGNNVSGGILDDNNLTDIERSAIADQSNYRADESC
jgi:hypothetical protein